MFEFAFWLYTHYQSLLRFIPFGGRIWYWSDRYIDTHRIEAYNQRKELK